MSTVLVGASSDASCAAPLFLNDTLAEADWLDFRSLVDRDTESYVSRLGALPTALQPSGAFVQRLKADSKGAAFSKKLKCMIPRRKLTDLSRRHSFDRELLDLKLKRGRACQHTLCSLDRCGLHVRDGVITAEEAALLVAHGDGVLDAERASARDVREHWPYVRIDFLRSAHNGSAEGHLLSLRVAGACLPWPSAAFCGLPCPALSFRCHATALPLTSHLLSAWQSACGGWPPRRSGCRCAGSASQRRSSPSAASAPGPQATWPRLPTAARRLTSRRPTARRRRRARAASSAAVQRSRWPSAAARASRSRLWAIASDFRLLLVAHGGV